MVRVPGFSLQVFLPDGRPDGVRVVTKSHWTGVAVMTSRPDYPKVRERSEFGSTGVYVLVGPSEADPSIREIYIGEGDVLSTRLNAHLADLDFWTDVIVFTKTDGTFNKAHVRNLEAELVARARQAKRYRVRNATSPAPPTPDEPTRADLEAFLEDMLVIYRLLGVDAFEEPTESSAASADELLTLSLGGVSATAQFTSEGFVVRSGATAPVPEKGGFSPGYQAQRNSLRASGVFKEEDGILRLTQDYVFTTPSAAAAILYGGQVSGPVHWKYPTGESIKDRESKNAGLDPTPESP